MSNNPQYTDSYRTAVSLLQRKCSGTNRYRRALRSFRFAYTNQPDDEARNEFAQRCAERMAREVRR